MTLKSQIAADVTGVFLNTDEFAESATYTPSGGSSRSITIVVVEQKTTEDETRNTRKSERQLTTFCKLHATTGIDSPRHNDYLTYNSEDWNFKHVVDRDEAGITIMWSTFKDVSTRG